MGEITQHDLTELNETVAAAAGGFGKGCPLRNARARDLRAHRQFQRRFAQLGRVRWSGGSRIARTE